MSECNSFILKYTTEQCWHCNKMSIIFKNFKSLKVFDNTYTKRKSNLHKEFRKELWPNNCIKKKTSWILKIYKALKANFPTIPCMWWIYDYVHVHKSSWDVWLLCTMAVASPSFNSYSILLESWGFELHWIENNILQTLLKITQCYCNSVVRMAFIHMNKILMISTPSCI